MISRQYFTLFKEDELSEHETDMRQEALKLTNKLFEAASPLNVMSLKG